MHSQSRNLVCPSKGPEEMGHRVSPTVQNLVQILWDFVVLRSLYQMRVGEGRGEDRNWNWFYRQEGCIFHLSDGRELIVPVDGCGGVSSLAVAMPLAWILQFFLQEPGQREDKKVKRDTKESEHMEFLKTWQEKQTLKVYCVLFKVTHQVYIRSWSKNFRNLFPRLGL